MKPKFIFSKFLVPLCHEFSLDMQLSQNETSLEPKKHYRSEAIIISSTALFYCNVLYEYEYQWTLKKLNPATLESIETIDLSSNPSAKYSEFQILENTLMYGLYQVELRLDVSFNVTKKLNKTAETFFEVVSMGLNISATKNVISEITIGRRQGYYLEPNVYSIDLDELIGADQMKFLFFCQTLNVSSSQSLVIFLILKKIKKIILNFISPKVVTKTTV